MNIVSVLLQSAKQYPDKVAILEKDRSVTFKELVEQSSAKANALKAQGVKVGDKVLIAIPFSIDLYVHIVALWLLGARIVLKDSIFPKKVLEQSLQHVNCKFVLTNKAIYFFRLFLFTSEVRKKLLKPSNASQDNTFLPHKNNESDTALITFTSGTTGTPKMANRTHRFLKIQLDALINEMQLNPSDVHLTSLPVVLMCNFAVGATSIIPSKSNNDFLAVQKVTMFSASPSHSLTFLKAVKPGYLRKVFIGGAVVLPSFVKTLSQKVDLETVQFAYGCTEIEPISMLFGSNYIIECEERGLLVGKPHSDLEVKILVDDRLSTQDRTIGEVVVHGKHVLPEYIGDKNHNKLEIDGNRWHKTGDAGYILNGEIYYMGRMNYLWKDGGETYSPVVVEKLLSRELKIEGTALYQNDRVVLYLEKSSRSKQAEVEALLPFGVSKIKWLRKFPRDKRHLSRINYAELF